MKKSKLPPPPSVSDVLTTALLCFHGSKERSVRKLMRKVIKKIDPLAAAPLQTKLRRPMVVYEAQRRHRKQTGWFKEHVLGLTVDPFDISGYSKRDAARLEEYQPAENCPVEATKGIMSQLSSPSLPQRSPEQQRLLQRYRSAKFRVSGGETQCLIDSDSQWCSMAWFRQNGYV